MREDPELDNTNFVFFRDFIELDHSLISTQITALLACSMHQYFQVLDKKHLKRKVIEHFDHFLIRPRRGGLLSQTLTPVLAATRCFSNCSQRKSGPGKYKSFVEACQIEYVSHIPLTNTNKSLTIMSILL